MSANELIQLIHDTHHLLAQNRLLRSGSQLEPKPIADQFVKIETCLLEAQKQIESGQLEWAKITFDNVNRMIRPAIEEYVGQLFRATQLIESKPRLSSERRASLWDMLNAYGGQLTARMPAELRVEQVRMIEWFFAIGQRHNPDHHPRESDLWANAELDEIVMSCCRELRQITERITRQNAMISHLDLNNPRTVDAVPIITMYELSIDTQKPLGFGIQYKRQGHAPLSAERLAALYTSAVRKHEAEPETFLIVGPDLRCDRPSTSSRGQRWKDVLGKSLHEIVRHMKVRVIVSLSAYMHTVFNEDIPGIERQEIGSDEVPEPGRDNSVQYFAFTPGRWSKPDEAFYPFTGSVGRRLQFLIHRGDTRLRVVMLGFESAEMAATLLKAVVACSPNGVERSDLLLACGERPSIDGYEVHHSAEALASVQKHASCFISPTLQDHFACIATLGQLASISKSVDHMRRVRELRPHYDSLCRHLLTGVYEPTMDRICGGGNNKAIRTQVPLTRRSGRRTVDYPTLLTAMAREGQERYTLVASAGSGKTTQLLFVASEILRLQIPGMEARSDQHRAAAADERSKLVEHIPIVLRVPEIAAIYARLVGDSPTYTGEEELVKAIVIALSVPGPDRKYLESALYEGLALLLIDGLDEVDAGNEHPREFVTALLTTFSRCPAVLTSRTREALPPCARAWPVLTLQHLRDELVREYVDGRLESATAAKQPVDGLAALKSHIQAGIPNFLHLTRQPILLRLYCDSLVAAPTSDLRRDVPSDRSGMYEHLAHLICKATATLVHFRRSAPPSADGILDALGGIAHDMMCRNGSVAKIGYFAGVSRKLVIDVLARRLVDHGVKDRGEAAQLAEAFMPREDDGNTGVPPLFEKMPAGNIRFSHRSVIEFLAARHVYHRCCRAAQNDANIDSTAVSIFFNELGGLGDDRETSRFFAGFLLRGRETWQRDAAETIIRNLIKSGRDAEYFRVLLLLSDVGDPGTRGAAAENNAWRNLIDRSLQRELEKVIRSTKNWVFGREQRDQPLYDESARHASSTLTSDVSTEVVRLLDPFINMLPRNPFLMQFAMDIVDEVAGGNSVDVGAEGVQLGRGHVAEARRVRDECWKQSAQWPLFCDPVPVDQLEKFAHRWKPGNPVPRPNLVHVPGGEVWHPESQMVSKIEGFYLADTLVTRAQWRVFTEGVCDNPEDLLLPQGGVIWYEAMIFARWVFGGLGTLPTRSQWLRAVVNGKKIDQLPWSDEESQSRANTSVHGRGGPTKVTTFPTQAGDPSLDLRDLVGNLWQWSYTPYLDEARVVELQKRSINRRFEYDPKEGYAGIIMGGSFAHTPEHGWCRLRFPSAPENFVHVIGARVALSLEGAAKWQHRVGHSSRVE